MLHKQLDAHQGSEAPFKLVAPTREDMVQWLIAAWGELTPATVAAGFSSIVEPAALSSTE